MRHARVASPAAIAVAAIFWGLNASPGAAQETNPIPNRPPPEKAGQVAEVRTLLSNLSVDKPRAYKSMLVFPLRYEGKQAPGDWDTMDKAVQAGRLKILEKEQASVSEVQMENVSDAAVFLMSGEIIKGGKQTRLIRKDTVIEARQKATVPVFCVEQHRWSGGVNFNGAGRQAPAAITGAIKAGAGQSEVWLGADRAADAMGVEASPTANLNEALESERARKEFKDLHKELGKFSPPETIGIAIADARTGRAVGLELFSRRDLFENLQDKLVEGYAVDLVLSSDVRAAVEAPEAKTEVTEKTIMDCIRQALSGASQYESTPASGRGIDLASGTLHGKGVAVGDMVIHLSIQETRMTAMPAKPIVGDRPTPQPMPYMPR